MAKIEKTSKMSVASNTKSTGPAKPAGKPAPAKGGKK